MSGTLTQLAAKGAQDRNLTINPEITFFKGVWKHHTNFAMEALEVDFISGQPKCGSSATAEIPRSGDLITDIWVKIKLKPLMTPSGLPFDLGNPLCVTYVDEVGHALLKRVQVEIGGHKFDAHTSEYLHMWHELTKKPGRDTDRLLGKFDSFADRLKASSETQNLYVPLRFWFNETTSQALPLVALMYHQVKIQVDFRSASEIIAATPALAAKQDGDEIQIDTPPGWPLSYEGVGAPDVNKHTAAGFARGDILKPSLVSALSAQGVTHDQSATDVAEYFIAGGGSEPIESCKLLVNYVFLDSVERKLFATMEHNYLIDVLQTDNPTYTISSQTNSMTVTLNHPIKELIWAVRTNDSVSDSPTTNSATTTALVQARGTQRWGQWAGSTQENGAVKALGGQAANLNGNTKSFFNFTGGSYQNTELHSFETATLKLNGHARFENVAAPFFRTVQPAKYHSSTPKSMIYNYSFALDPEDWKPTGSINMSRIDTVKLELKQSDKAHAVAAKPASQIFVFGRAINIMKITSGMAGLKYAN